MNDKQLTQQEKLFCELFVHGEAPYGGNPFKSYSKVFGGREGENGALIAQLLSRKDIQDHINILNAQPLEDAVSIKRYLTRNLKHIIDETSTAVYYDRRGTVLSPAPLRSVAVQASKALMEMYPVKEANTTHLNIEGGDGQCSVNFNVIVPNASTEGEESK